MATPATFSLPPDTIKAEMEGLLVKALAEENAPMMEELFHAIVDKSNVLRQQYGLPTQVERHPMRSVLRTPTEQLHVAGVGHESVLGLAVHARANADAVQPGQVCLFDQCFTNPTSAQECRNYILAQIAQESSMTQVTIYPPLLLRASRNEVLFLRVYSDTKVQVADRTTANMLLILQENGAVVPVTDRHHPERCPELLKKLYSLTGEVRDLSTLQQLIGVV